MIAYKTALIRSRATQVKPVMQMFLETLAAYPDEIFVVTSAFRTALENQDAGGLPNSKHLTGEAIDLRTRSLSPKGEAFIKRVCTEQRLKLVDESDHLHIQAM
jgi:hypothetical protein